MKTLYFDCPSGISGDMCLGALLDLGAPKIDAGFLRRELARLNLPGFKLKAGKERRHGISATAVSVIVAAGRRRERSFKEIKALIAGSALSMDVKRISVDIFATLAEAEGKVHDVNAEEVHFHEIGAVDSIVDIVGTAILINALGAEKILASALPPGSGVVKTRHGVMPVPAPATLELMKGLVLAPSPASAELTTPTGAAIIKTLAKSSSPMPAMRIERVGYGAGSMDFKEIANVLRVVVGESVEAHNDATQAIEVIETEIDDMSPQIAGYLMERLFLNGALDVYFTAVQMKKSRPGFLLTVLSAINKRDALIEIILRESTSIGVRFHTAQRKRLERETVKVKTRFGEASVKVSKLSGKPVNYKPEYEELKSIAEAKGVALKDLMNEVTAVMGSCIKGA
jgi:hypothetical protein